MRSCTRRTNPCHRYSPSSLLIVILTILSFILCHDVVNSSKIVKKHGTSKLRRAINESKARVGYYIIVFDKETTTIEEKEHILNDYVLNVRGVERKRSFANAFLAESIYVADDDDENNGGAGDAVGEDEHDDLERHRTDDEYVSFGDSMLASRERREIKLQTLIDNAKVQLIEEEQYVSLMDTVTTATADNHESKQIKVDQRFPPNTGLDRIDQKYLPLDDRYHYEYTGRGVTAYVVDTGIRSTHDEFAIDNDGDGSPTSRVTCGFNAFEESEDCNDYNGHGTHMAGIVGGKTYGVAKEVNLVSIKVFDKNGNSTTSAVVAGLDHLVGQGLLKQQEQSQTNKATLMVANLSFGTYYSRVLNLLVTYATVHAGILFSVAAGNDNVDACTYSPGSAIPVMTVGSTITTTTTTSEHEKQEVDQRASTSNYGRCVDVFAPGGDTDSSGAGHAIRSAWYVNDSAHKKLSGTSVSAAFVTGAAALFMEDDATSTLTRSVITTPNLIKQRIIVRSTPHIISEIKGSPNLLVCTKSLERKVDDNMDATNDDGSTTTTTPTNEGTDNSRSGFAARTRLNVLSVIFAILAIAPLVYWLQTRRLGHRSRQQQYQPQENIQQHDDDEGHLVRGRLVGGVIS